VLSPGPKATEKDITLTKDLFGAIGQVLILKEHLMDAVTALSGSGPAFVAYFIQALIEAGIREGLTAEDARTLVVQTVQGTVKLIESGRTAPEVINMVSSPGGTTVEGLYVLDQGRLRATVKKAIRAARERSEQLRRQ
jgi:pyrroline-5-carboxylate reductase